MGTLIALCPPGGASQIVREHNAHNELVGLAMELREKSGGTYNVATAMRIDAILAAAEGRE